MPVRSIPSPFAARFKQLFHSSAARPVSKQQNHYEVLQVSPNATPAEVKKSFYSLSKTHHPDRNPDDPNASERFVKISEAWSILGTPAKRQAYDREHAQVHRSHSHHHTPRGSYSSTHTPAGGRPASGLSRRRTQFRGPPPSFYASGGWGQHSEKRQAAQGEGAPGAEQPTFDQNLGGTAGGMGYGQSPMGQAFEHNLKHFDRVGHLKTHENQDSRRRRRRGPSGDYVPDELPRGMFANFVFIGGIIGVGIFLPGFLFERFVARRGRADRYE